MRAKWCHGAGDRPHPATGLCFWCGASGVVGRDGKLTKHKVGERRRPRA